MRNLVFLILFLLSSACSKISLSQSLSGTSQNTRDREKSQINSKEKFQSRFGGTLKLTQRGQDAKTLNPWTSTEATSGEYGSLMFPGLVKFNPDTDVAEPLLAESFEISKDEKTITVKLRENLYWSDSRRITADDVLFTWNELLIQGIALSSARDIININGKFPEVTKLDDKTIEFKTSEVFAPFLRNLGIEIAPKHDVERFFKKYKAKTFSEKQKAFEKYLSIFTKPEDIVSSGPFKFSKIQRGERIEFVRNPLYYDVDAETGKRLPYFNRLIYSYVQDDSADIFKFLAKESDVLGVSPANAALAKQLSKKYNYTLYDLGTSNTTNFIWFNLSKNVPKPQYDWFNNLVFREAVSLAIDRKSIINNVYQGLGTPLSSALGENSPFVNLDLKVNKRASVKDALKLLIADGFRFDAKNKILYDKNSNRVEFDLLSNSGSRERELMGVIISDNLAEIGIKVNFKLLEFNNYVGRIMQGQNYSAGILALGGGSNNEPNTGANVWKSDGRLHLFDPKGFQKQPLIRDWEREIDDLFIRGVQTLDFNERKLIYDEFQATVFKYKPLIYLASPKTFAAIRNDLRGIRKTKYGGMIPDIAKCYRACSETPISAFSSSS